MNVPFEGELTATEQRVYDIVSDPMLDYTPTSAFMAEALDLDRVVVDAVCDGLEAMGFIRRLAGMWVPG